MAKITLNDIVSGFSLQRINDNFSKIADALNNQVFYRDNPVGETNTLKSDIDANSHHIFNLPAPVTDNEPARLKDVKSAIAGQAGLTANLINFEATPYIPAANVQAAIQKSGTYSVDGVTETRSVNSKLADAPNVKDYRATGDSATDDTVALRASVNALGQRGALSFAPALAYKITDTLEVFGKAGSVIDFGNQQINAGTFATPKVAIHFKGMSQAIINDIFLIGNTAKVSTGVLFEADASNPSIHMNVGKIYVAGCNVGIQVGAAGTYQVSDSVMSDLYASDCNLGIVFSGENTLAMKYGRVSAYNNSVLGVHFEQGGGSVESLQVAASGNDIYFGQTSGANHNKLARWDILSGYSEEGVNGEVFINSAKCSDTNPFREQVVISGYRVTPFSSTNVQDFIQWRLNGDLILRNVSINHGQQMPRIKVDANTTYRQPKVIVEDSTIDCNPKTEPQVMMTYTLSDPRQEVELTVSVDNGLSWWNNNGSTNEGKIARGVYMRKPKAFVAALMSKGGLISAWTLKDLPSGTCLNTIPNGPSLSLSSPMETRDFWLDDGLIGFFKNATTSKTLSTASSKFSAGEYTFGCILRPSTVGVDESSYTNVGGSSGLRLGLGNTGGGFVRTQIGAFNCQGTPTNPYDAHLVIGRFRPKDPVGTEPGHVKVDAINLRTGEITSARVASGPAIGDFTWTNGMSIRNDGCVRGMPFVYNRSLEDNEVFGILQSSLSLTDTWR